MDYFRCPWVPRRRSTAQSCRLHASSHCAEDDPIIPQQIWWCHEHDDAHEAGADLRRQPARCFHPGRARDNQGQRCSCLWFDTDSHRQEQINPDETGGVVTPWVCLRAFGNQGEQFARQALVSATWRTSDCNRQGDSERVCLGGQHQEEKLHRLWQRRQMRRDCCLCAFSSTPPPCGMCLETAFAPPEPPECSGFCDRDSITNSAGCREKGRQVQARALRSDAAV